MIQPPHTQARYGIAAITSVFALLLVMTLGAFTFVQVEHGERLRIDAAEQRKWDLVSLLQTLVDAETGQRGYLLTGDPEYLLPYRNAASKIAQDVTAFERHFSATPAERLTFDKFSSAINAKMTELSTTVALYKAGDQASAIDLVRSNFGKDRMDDIRAQIAKVLIREDARIALLHHRLREYATLLRIIVVGTSIVLFATATLTIWYLLRVLGETTAAAEGIKRANQEILLQTQQREEAETQLRQIQKMESLGQLAGGLAHDLNNMLTVIIGGLSVFKRRYERGDTGLLRYIDAAEEAAGNAATVTQRMLAFSRQQSLAPRHLDVNRFVGSTSELLRHAMGGAIQLETVLAGGIWPVFADSSQLENALLNLAINARDAMPGGGRLTIETSNAHLDEAYATTNPESRAGQYVLIAITDTGSGMNAATIARAFDPFFTTKGVGQGTGLGLSQVYGFVKQSDGHIKIYSEIGEGTTMKVYLPRHRAADAPGQTGVTPIETAMPMAEAGTIVLVVDDEAPVRVVTAETLRELGYKVLEAGSGAEGLALLDEHPDIAVLLTDVMMPGMNGRQLAEEACRRRPGLRVLYASGYTRNAVVHNGIIDPGVHLLSKPFTMAELGRKLKEVLAGPDAAPLARA
ncbi:CHASE3 domain-containing protein [Acidisoma cellulosilytica]|uniref:histidine kinase n=1 Tax=Acidisoma cellulosilyticum TaxID=2802395 RepID=A0A964E305_9PROT|nr:CHASE3 domain-containing protein [Acidisoma cellulosilyticum]MCB8880185.1 CHASE3 domain-containing protein [Acidisoma cellulosilyticum]